MNLHRLLLQREAAHNPLRVGLIGAGKFGSMYLAQARVTPGIHLVAIVDLSASSAREAGMRTGWPAEAIGATTVVVATAKRDLREGDVLNGEGGYTVYGRLMPAADSLAAGGLPIGLAHRVRLTQPVAAGQPVRCSDVAIDQTSLGVRVRREMEREFAADGCAA